MEQQSVHKQTDKLSGIAVKEDTIMESAVEFRFYFVSSSVQKMTRMP